MRLIHSTALASLLLLPLLSGCGTDTIAPPEGGFELHFTSSTVSTQPCQIQEHNGMVWEGNMPLTQTQYQKTPAVENQDGATIQCTVAASGSGFTVSASASQSGDDLSFNITSISSKNTETNPAHGSLSYASPQTGNVFSSPKDTPCNFFFTKDTPESVRAGNVYVSFVCDELVSASSTCSAQSGVAVFEGCLQTVAE